MKKEPSIHLYKSTFKYLLEKNGIHLTNSELANFMKQARGVSISHRSVLVKASKARKVKLRVESSLKEANLLADIIYSVRISLKHFGVTKVQQKDPEWDAIKALVPIVNSFCESHHLSQREGYIAFVTVAFEILSSQKNRSFKSNASWMKNKAEWINARYEINQEIKLDPSPSDTRLMYDTYCSIVYEKTGLSQIDYRNPKEYIHFLRAKQEADSIGVDYGEYMEAQFEALEFCNGIPNLEDLYGDKARTRLTRYLSKHNYTLKPQNSKIDKDIWNSFKN